MTLAQYFLTEGEADAEGTPDFHAKVVGAFEEVALMTTVDSVPLNDVLRLVGQRLCELLEVGRCSVYLRRDDGYFQGQVGYCVGRSIDTGVSRLVSGVRRDKFTTEIVDTASPVIVRDAAHDPRTIQSTMRRWGVMDMLGVPLVVDGDVIGIIYVDDIGRRRDFSQRDVTVAQAFAGLCAIAVRQRWLYQQLEERAKIIDHQRRILGDSTVVHSRVTRAVLDGADIEAILRLIVELLGKPVVLYGPSLKVTSWAAPESSDVASCPGLQPEHLNLQWVRKGLDALHNGSPSTTLRATPETRCRRLMVRMVADGQCVGYLELCELGRAFSPVDSKALEQAAMAIALKLLADQRNADLRRQEREEYFADILYGRRDLASLTGRAESCGLDLSARHVILRLEYDEDGAEDISIGRRRRTAALSCFARHLGDAGKTVASTSVAGADLALIEVPPSETGSPDGPLGRSLRLAFPEAEQRFGLRFAVVSDPARKLSDLPAAAERLRETLAMLRETARTSCIVFARDVEMLRLISRREGIAGIQKHSADILAPLLEYDSESSGALLPTLAAFVDCEAQIRSTAAFLGVHENTVRYRLKRISEISTIDPMRLDSLTTVRTALQVRRLTATGD